MKTQLLSNIMTQLVVSRLFKVLEETIIQIRDRLREHQILNPTCVSQSLYLVASHVVTLVHDHSFTSLVSLSNIQTRFRSRVSNLMQTQTSVRYSCCCVIRAVCYIFNIQIQTKGNGTYCTKSLWV